MAGQAKRARSSDQALFRRMHVRLQAAVDGREDLANQRTHDGDGGDDDYGYEHQDQRVLDHALSFFFESEFHDNNLLVYECYVRMGVFDSYILSAIPRFRTNKDVRSMTR